jgi:hypothetical protein
MVFFFFNLEEIYLKLLGFISNLPQKRRKTYSNQIHEMDLIRVCLMFLKIAQKIIYCIQSFLFHTILSFH